MERDPFEGVDRDARIDELLEDPRLVIKDGVVWCVACNERIVPLAAVGHAEDALRAHLETPETDGGSTAQPRERELDDDRRPHAEDFTAEELAVVQDLRRRRQAPPSRGDLSPEARPDLYIDEAAQHRERTLREGDDSMCSGTQEE